jgi:lysozyme family protein
MQFDTVYAATMKLEGGYANNPNDKGGETYCGISRRFHPTWFGWKIIDRINAKQKIKHNEIFVELNGYVKAFYKLNFWNKIEGDFLKRSNIQIEVFDTAVNCGVGVASKNLQRALNLLNHNQKLWPDLIVDGLIGNKTIDLQTKLSLKKATVLLKILKILRGAYYINIAERRNDQEVWIENWLGRV